MANPPVSMSLRPRLGGLPDIEADNADREGALEAFLARPRGGTPAPQQWGDFTRYVDMRDDPGMTREKWDAIRADPELAARHKRAPGPTTPQGQAPVIEDGLTEWQLKQRDAEEAQRWRDEQALRGQPPQGPQQPNPQREQEIAQRERDNKADLQSRLDDLDKKRRDAADEALLYAERAPQRNANNAALEKHLSQYDDDPVSRALAAIEFRENQRNAKKADRQKVEDDLANQYDDPVMKSLKVTEYRIKQRSESRVREAQEKQDLLEYIKTRNQWQSDIEQRGYGSSLVREVRGALETGGASLISTIARLTGNSAAADELNRGINTYSEAKEKARQNDWSPYASSQVGGIAESLALMAATPGGLPAKAIGAGLTTANKALTTATDAGITGGARLRYAATQGGVETAFALLGNKLFGPGIDSRMLGKEVAARTWKQLAKNIGMDTLKELPEELLTTAFQDASTKLEGVDPNMTLDDFVQHLADTVVATVGQSAVVNVPNAARIATGTVPPAATPPVNRSNRDNLTDEDLEALNVELPRVKSKAENRENDTPPPLERGDYKSYDDYLTAIANQPTQPQQPKQPKPKQTKQEAIAAFRDDITGSRSKYEAAVKAGMKPLPPNVKPTQENRAKYAKRERIRIADAIARNQWLEDVDDAPLAPRRPAPRRPAPRQPAPRQDAPPAPQQLGRFTEDGYIAPTKKELAESNDNYTQVAIAPTKATIKQLDRAIDFVGYQINENLLIPRRGKTDDARLKSLKDEQQLYAKIADEKRADQKYAEDAPQRQPDTTWDRDADKADAQGRDTGRLVVDEDPDVAPPTPSREQNYAQVAADPQNATRENLLDANVFLNDRIKDNNRKAQKGEITNELRKARNKSLQREITSNIALIRSKSFDGKPLPETQSPPVVKQPKAQPTPEQDSYVDLFSKKLQKAEQDAQTKTSTEKPQKPDETKGRQEGVLNTSPERTQAEDRPAAPQDAAKPVDPVKQAEQPASRGVEEGKTYRVVTYETSGPRTGTAFKDDYHIDFVAGKGTEVQMRLVPPRKTGSRAVRVPIVLREVGDQTGRRMWPHEATLLESGPDGKPVDPGVPLADRLPHIEELDEEVARIVTRKERFGSSSEIHDIKAIQKWLSVPENRQRYQSEFGPRGPRPKAAPKASPVATGEPSPDQSPKEAGPVSQTPVRSFETEKGSKYEQFEDGTTQRNKAKRDDVGHEGDFGDKKRSAKTVYVDSDAAALSAAGVNEDSGGVKSRVVLRDGKATLLMWNTKEGRWGASPSSRDIAVHTEPAVGRYPLELWSPRDDVPGYEAYGSMHAGNKIVRMSPDKAKPVSKPEPSPETAPAAKPPVQKFTELTPAAQALFNQGYEANDPNLLAKNNLAYNKEFENRTGIKLPNTVKGRNQAVLDWAKPAAPDKPKQKTGIVQFLSDRYAALKERFAKDAGVSEGYTVGEHTQRVVDRLNLSNVPEHQQELMQWIAALHDIGKGEAVSSGDKSKQHQYTLPVMRNILKAEGFSDADIAFAEAMVDQDIIGEMLQGKMSPITAATKLEQQAKRAGIDKPDFLTMAKALYKADAGSYPRVEQAVMPEGKITDSRLAMLEEQVYGEAIESPWIGGIRTAASEAGRQGSRRGAALIHASAYDIQEFDGNKDSGKNLVGPGVYLLKTEDADVAKHYAERALKRVLSLFSAGTRPRIEAAKTEAEYNDLIRLAQQKQEANPKDAKRWRDAATVLRGLRDGQIGKLIHTVEVDLPADAILDLGADETGGRVLTEAERTKIANAVGMEASKLPTRGWQLYGAIANVTGREALNAALQSIGYRGIAFLHRKGGYSRRYPVLNVLNPADAHIKPPSKPQENKPKPVEKAPEHTQFHSGLSRSPSEVDAAIASGNGVGVSAFDSLSAPMRKKLVDYANAGGKVFIDSGAFTALTKGKDLDWDKVLFTYHEMVTSVDKDKRSNVTIVAPDIVGNHDATIDLQQDLRDKFEPFLESGATVIFPVQQGGHDSLAANFADLTDTFGDLMESVTLGVPFNAKAWTQDDVLEFMRYRDNQQEAFGGDRMPFHLLGAGPAKVEKLFEAAAAEGLSTEGVSADAMPKTISQRKSGKAPEKPQETKPKAEKPAAVSEPAKAPEKPVKAEDDVDKTLRQAGLKVEQLADGTWQITGNTYEHSKEIGDVKRQLPELGGRWDKDKKRWTFKRDPQRELSNRLAGKGTGEESTNAVSRDEQVAREDARREQEARPDAQRPSGDYVANVDQATKDLIARGLNFGMTQEVVDNQIEDIGRVVDAAESDRQMFMIGSAPGTGKTFVLGGVIRELRRRGFDKFVYVTQNQDLISQVQGNLADYGLEGVEFTTYTKARSAAPSTSGAVLLLDEAHSAKNIDLATGKAVRSMVSDSRFTVYATATPFENVTEADYLAPSGIFKDIHVEFQRPSSKPGGKPFTNKLDGFPAWAWTYGANVYFVKNRSGDLVPVVWWKKHQTSEQDQLAANEWLQKRGVYVQRPMSLPAGTVNSEMRGVDADPYWADISNEVVQIYADAESEAENNTEAGQIKAHKVNVLKRLLEASKVDAAIARAKELIGDGKKDDPQVIIFVNTKVATDLGTYTLSEPYRKERGIKGKEASRRYKPPEVDRMMQSWYEAKAEAKRMGETAGPPPFAPFIHKIAMAMDRAGVLKKFPSVIDKIMGQFPGQVVEFSGRTPSQNANNLAKWKNNEAKLIVATMDKGGTGLSFHDTTGTMPSRYQVNMNLPWSGTKVEQVSGRLARYGTAKPVTLEWLFANNIPFDRELSKTVGSRMRSMSAAVQGRKSGEAKQIRDFDFEDLQPEAPEATPAKAPAKEAPPVATGVPSLAPSPKEAVTPASLADTLKQIKRVLHGESVGGNAGFDENGAARAGVAFLFDKDTQEVLHWGVGQTAKGAIKERYHAGQIEAGHLLINDALHNPVIAGVSENAPQSVNALIGISLSSNKPAEAVSEVTAPEPAPAAITPAARRDALLTQAGPFRNPGKGFNRYIAAAANRLEIASNKRLSNKKLNDLADVLKKSLATQEKNAAKAKPKASPAKGRSLSAAVLEQGGISTASLKDYNLKELRADGLRGVIKPSGQPLDEVAQVLVSSGALRVPDNQNASDYLIEQLKVKADRADANYSDAEMAKQEKAEREIHDRLQELKDAGLDPAGIDGLRERSEEAETHAVDEGEDDFVPFTEREANEIIDTSFDFGSNVKAETADETPVDEKPPINGSRFEHDGTEYEVFKSRHGVTEAHPVVNGKPVVNRETTKRFASSDLGQQRNPDLPRMDTDDKPFELKRPEKTRKKAEDFGTNPKSKQNALFDPGKNDLPGQPLLFNTDPGDLNNPNTMENKAKAEKPAAAEPGSQSESPADAPVESLVRHITGEKLNDPTQFRSLYGELSDADKVAVAKELGKRGLLIAADARKTKPMTASEIIAYASGQYSTAKNKHTDIPTNRNIPFSDSAAFKQMTTPTAPAVETERQKAANEARAAVEAQKQKNAGYYQDLRNEWNNLGSTPGMGAALTPEMLDAVGNIVVGEIRLGAKRFSVLIGKLRAELDDAIVNHLKPSLIAMWNSSQEKYGLDEATPERFEEAMSDTVDVDVAKAVEAAKAVTPAAAKPVDDDVIDLDKYGRFQLDDAKAVTPKSPPQTPPVPPKTPQKSPKTPPEVPKKSPPVPPRPDKSRTIPEQSPDDDDDGPRISIKKAKRAERREELGLDQEDIVSKVGHSFPELDAEAKRVAPGEAETVFTRIGSGEEAADNASDRDVFVMLNHYAKKQMATRKTQDALDAARKAGDDFKVVKLEAKLNVQVAEEVRLMDIAKSAGTAAGRALAAFKAILKYDMSLARLRMRLDAAADGKTTDAQAKAQNALHAKYEAAVKDLEAKTKAADENLTRALIAEQIAKDMQAKAKPGKAAPGKPTATRLQTALKELRRSKIAFSGVGLPLTPEHIEVAAAYIEEKVTTFKDFIEKLTKFYGKKPEAENLPVFQQAWDTAWENAKNQKPSAPPEVSIEPDNPQSLVKAAKALFRHFLSEGITNTDAVIDAVHEELQNQFPEEIGERLDTMMAMVDYNRERTLSDDPLDILAADKRAVVQMKVHLERMRRGMAANRLDPRYPVTDEQRAHRKMVAEEKRKGGFVVTDPARQATTALAALETRLRHAISDTLNEIANKAPTVPNKTASPTSDTIEDLKAYLDLVRGMHKAVFGDRKMTKDQKLKAAEAAAVKNEAYWNDRLARAKAGDFSTGRTKSDPFTNATIAEIKARSDAAKKQVAELNALANPKPDPKIKARETAAAKNLEYWTDRLARAKAGDFSTGKTKSTPVTNAKIAAIAAQSELAKAQTKELKALAGPDPEDDAISDARYLTSLQNQIAKKLERIADIAARSAAGDFTPERNLSKEKREANALRRKDDASLRDARIELDKTTRDLNEHIEQTRKSNLTYVDLAKRVPGGVISLARDIAFGGELSFILKQGAPHVFGTLAPAGKIARAGYEAITGNPNAAKAKLRQARQGYGKLGRALAGSLKAFLWKTDTELARSQDANKQRPGYKNGMYKAMGVPVEDGGTLTVKEEVFLNNLVETGGLALDKTFPGFKGFRDGHPVFTKVAHNLNLVNRFSNATKVFMSTIRADIADNAAEVWTMKRGEMTPAEARSLGRITNFVTGKGDMKSIGMDDEQALGFLGRLFISAPWLKSRFDMLMDPVLSLNPWSSRRTLESRKIAAEIYVDAAAGVAAYYGAVVLAAMFYNDDDDERPVVEWDSTSSDFMKPRWGKTRIDPLFGLQQLIVMGSRMYHGTYKDHRGDIQKREGNSDLFELGGQFLKGRLHPWIQAAAAIYTQEDFNGQPITTAEVLKRMPIPVTYPDIVEASKNRGIPASTALGLWGFIGGGLQTNQPRTKDRRDIAEELRIMQRKINNPNTPADLRQSLQGQADTMFEAHLVNAVKNQARDDGDTALADQATNHKPGTPLFPELTEAIQKEKHDIIMEAAMRVSTEPKRRGEDKEFSGDDDKGRNVARSLVPLMVPNVDDAIKLYDAAYRNKNKTIYEMIRGPNGNLIKVLKQSVLNGHYRIKQLYLQP